MKMSRRKNRVKSLRINRLRMNGSPTVSPMDEMDSESVVSSTTDAEPRKVKPLIIKRTWTKIEPPMAGSPPTLVLRSIPGSNQGSRKYNVEVAKLLLRLNTSASTKGGEEPTERAVSSSSKDDDSPTEDMSSDVDENYLAIDNDEHEMTENEAIDEKVQVPSNPQPEIGICEVCQTQLTLKNPLGIDIRKKNIPIIIGHSPVSGSMQLFQCMSCGSDFSRRGNLVIHLRVHNEKHLYNCSYDTCHKSFRCIGELRAHERNHAYLLQRSPERNDQYNLRVSPANGHGDRIALRIFKAGSKGGGGGEGGKGENPPWTNRWNSTDLRTQVQGLANNPQQLTTYSHTSSSYESPELYCKH